MASLVSRLWMKLCKKRPALSIMIVGLDNSGKTSILNNLMSFNQAQASSSSSSHDNNTHRDNKSQQTPSSSTTSSLSTSATAPSTRKSQTNAGDGAAVSPTVGYNYERVHYKGCSLTVLDFSGQNRYRNLWQEFYNCVDAIVFVIDSSDLIRLVVVRDELETLLSHPYFGSLAGDSAAGDNRQSTSDKSKIEQQHQQLAPRIFAQKQITLNNQGNLIQSPLSDQTTTTTTTTTVASSGRQRIRVPILFLANKSDLPNSVDIEVIVRALNLNQLPKSRHPWLIQATSVNSAQGICEGFDWLASQLSALSTTQTNTSPTPTTSSPPPIPATATPQ